MARVKVTKVHPVAVVPHRPWRRWGMRFAGIVILVLAVYGAYRYGLQSGFSAQQSWVAERRALQAALAEAEKQQEALRMKVATLERGSLVDRQSNESSRQVIRDLTDQVARLEEEVALYQGIMSPSTGDEGLRVQEMTLEPTSSDNRFRYTLMLTQAGNNDQYLQGFVGVNIVGSQAGERVALPLKDVSDDIDDVDIKFRYRYFQDIKGDLVLPDGFVPDQIQVVAQAVGQRSARVEAAYDWSDLENGTNVGQ